MQLLHGCEQAALEEKARIAKEKELETASLRAKQERAADRQAEIDELRARRCCTVCLTVLYFLLSYAELAYASCTMLGRLGWAVMC